MKFIKAAVITFLFSILLLTTRSVWTEVSHQKDSQHTQKEVLAKWGAYYEKALEYLEDGDHASAVIELKNAIKTDATNFSAQLVLADIYLEQNKTRLAEILLRRVLERGASRDLVLKQLAQALIAQEKYEEFLDTIQIAGLPRELKAQLRVMSAKAYMGLHQNQKAERLLRDVLNTEPHFIPAHIERAKLNLILGRLDDAKSKLQSLDDKANLIPDYWLLKAEIARREGLVDEALSYASKAIALDPNYLEALYSRASMLLDTNKLAEAKEDIATIRGRYNDGLKGMILEYMLLRKQGREEDAKKILVEADVVIGTYNLLKLQDDPYNLFLVMTINNFAKKDQDTILMARRYIELVPENIEPYRMKISAELRLNKIDQALVTMISAMKHFPEHPKLLLLKGEILLKKKRYKEAIGLFEQLKLRAPENSDIAKIWAMAMLYSGKPDIAIEALQKISDAGDVATGITLANILFSLKRYDAALQLSKKLILQSPASESLYNILGNAQLGLEDNAAARSAFVQALTISPSFIPALFNLASLEIKEGNLKEAEKGFKAILQIDRQHTLSLVELSAVAERNKDIRQAIAFLEKAQNINMSVESGLRLAILLKHDGNIQGVNSQISKMLSRFPENLSVLSADAANSVANKYNQKAIHRFGYMSTIAKELGSSSWLLKIAKQQVALGDIIGADRTMVFAAQIAPYSLAVKIAGCEFDVFNEKYDEALTKALDIINTNPSAPAGYRLAGDINQRQDKEQKAADWYLKGLSRTKGNSRLAFKYYKFLQKAENQLTAVTFLENWSVTYKSQDPAVYRALAAGHAELGNTERAKKINEFLLAGAPNDVMVLNNLALLYLSSDLKKARELAEKANMINPGSVAIMDTLGWTMTLQGEVEAGLALLRKATAQSVKVSEIRYHYAVALHKSGKDKAARRELRDVVNSGQSFVGLDEAKALLAKLSKL